MSTEEETDRAPRKIKRYANRKLYDTTDSRYVTLQQIAEFVREGEDVRIIDNTTKEDLTNVTLAQIIYEEEKKADAGRVASVGTLRTMIQQSGEKLMDTLRGGPVGKLIPRKEGEEGEEGVDEVAGAVEEPGVTEGKRSVFLSPKEAIDELQRLADDRIRVLIGHVISRVHAVNDDVGKLQSRIEELESKLVALQERVGSDTGEGEDSTPDE